MRNLLNASLVMILVACGAPADEPADPASTTAGSEAAPPASADVPLPLAPLSFVGADGATVIELTGDGVVMMGGQDSGTHFSEDGTITRNGEPFLTMAADGTLTNQSGTVVATVAADGTATIGDRTFSFRPDGTVEGSSGNAPPLTLTPLDTSAKRAAMTILVLLQPLPALTGG